MKPSLSKRLEALEARPLPVDAEHQQRLHVAVCAMFDALEVEDRFGRSKADPSAWGHQSGTLLPLWQRIQAGTVTEDDRAMMEAWPKCHLSPAQLVEMAASLLPKGAGERHANIPGAAHALTDPQLAAIAFGRDEPAPARKEKA